MPAATIASSTSPPMRFISSTSPLATAPRFGPPCVAAEWTPRPTSKLSVRHRETESATIGRDVLLIPYERNAQQDAPANSGGPSRLQSQLLGAAVAELSALADVHRLVSIVALCLCFGCTTSGPVVITDVDRAVTESFSFRRAHAISPERVRWFSEGTDGSYPVINVGFDEGTHYTRSATLRVREHGVVERQEMRNDGELIWIADR